MIILGLHIAYCEQFHTLKKCAVIFSPVGVVYILLLTRTISVEFSFQF